MPGDAGFISAGKGTRPHFVNGILSLRKLYYPLLSFRLQPESFKVPQPLHNHSNLKILTIGSGIYEYEKRRLDSRPAKHAKHTHEKGDRPGNIQKKEDILLTSLNLSSIIAPVKTMNKIEFLSIGYWG
jgi:hypothetical protein